MELDWSIKKLLLLFRHLHHPLMCLKSTRIETRFCFLISLSNLSWFFYCWFDLSRILNYFRRSWMGTAEIEYYLEHDSCMVIARNNHKLWGAVEEFRLRILHSLHHDFPENENEFQKFSRTTSKPTKTKAFTIIKLVFSSRERKDLSRVVDLMWKFFNLDDTWGSLMFPKFIFKVVVKFSLCELNCVNFHLNFVCITWQLKREFHRFCFGTCDIWLCGTFF